MKIELSIQCIYICFCFCPVIKKCYKKCSRYKIFIIKKLIMSLTPEECTRIITMLEDGRSQRDTARTVGVSLSTVQRVVQRFRETGSNLRRPGTGKARCTTEREDRYLVTTMLRNRFLTGAALRYQFLLLRGSNPSVWTVRRRLAEAYLKPYRPANGPKLESEHREARQRYAREHLNWTLDDWSKVMFSDESKFMLYKHDGRLRVYRRPGERYKQACIEEKVAYGGGSILVWAGISSESRTELVLIENGTLNAERYVEEILNEHVGPFMSSMGENTIFMHDNARPHTARIVNDYLQEVGINPMEWPARSPDINPIEHAWDELGRSVRQRNTPPITLRELKNALIEEWENIPQHRLRNLVYSMPNRMASVLTAHGGNTKY